MADKKTPRPMPLGSPADYPIGSVESRARARAMVEAMPMTDEERRNMTPAERKERILKLLREGQRRVEMGCPAYPHTETTARIIQFFRDKAVTL